MDQEYPRIVIVGAGFGGLWAARTLDRSPFNVLLVDRNNYHTFHALLYQVAAAELEAEEIACSVRGILRKLPNLRFAMAEVEDVDFVARQVTTSERTISYDFLVLAMGTTSNFFALPGAAEYAFPLKTLEDATALRNQILRCFERAAQEPDAQQRQRLLTFAIVGGGPTGVEFAGALTELIHGPLMRDYPALDRKEVRVVLFEATDDLLPGLPRRLQAYTLARLRHMGIEVRLRSLISGISPEAVQLREGTVMPTDTVVWTAGVRSDPRIERWGLPTARNGRVTVLPTLQVAEHPEVYVIGDLAYLEEDGKALPMMAPVAIQQGVVAAQNIARQVAGQAPLPFHYRDRGTMVTIQRNAAVAHVFGRAFAGFPAWILWLTFHLLKLIGFRNRLLVLINWIWDYFLYERTVRLILAPKAAPAQAVTPEGEDSGIAPAGAGWALGGEAGRFAVQRPAH
jgi:NADH dehydrogenase